MMAVAKGIVDAKASNFQVTVHHHKAPRGNEKKTPQPNYQDPGSSFVLNTRGWNILDGSSSIAHMASHSKDGICLEFLTCYFASGNHDKIELCQ
jgi:hypothetical protein